MPSLYPSQRNVTCRLVTTGDLSVGKVFAKTIQKGLQTIAKDVLLDTQCGFRSGWGRINMMYCARQLVENPENTTRRSSCYSIT